MIIISLHLVQYNNQGPYRPMAGIKNNEVFINAMNEENSYEEICCRLDLPDFAIKWYYNVSDIINGFRVYRQYSRFNVLGESSDELICLKEKLQDKIPFTSNWQDMFDVIAKQAPQFEMNSKLVKVRDTPNKQLLKRMYEKLKVPCDEFKIQVFLKKAPHPNILQYNSHYIKDKKQYISLDYYKQGTLENIFYKFKDEIPLKMVREIMEQLLNGLYHLHSRGIMHRDIKPENIIVTNFDRIQIKIANFSQAVFGEQFTRFGGTKGYAAPEVVNRFIHTNKCDIFSTGVVFYELLNCKRIKMPFSPQNALAQLKDLGLNVEAVDLVSKMLEPDPIKRLDVDDCQSHDFFMGDNPISQIKNFYQIKTKQSRSKNQ